MKKKILDLIIYIAIVVFLVLSFVYSFFINKAGGSLLVMPAFENGEYTYLEPNGTVTTISQSEWIVHFVVTILIALFGLITISGLVYFFFKYLIFGHLKNSTRNKL